MGNAGPIPRELRGRRSAWRRLGILPVILGAHLGCASTFVLSPETVAFRATLDEGKAREIIAEALPEGGVRGSLREGVPCPFTLNGSWPHDVKVVDRRIEYLASYTETTSMAVVGSAIYYHYRWKNGRYHIDLDDLWRIRISSAEQSDASGHTSQTYCLGLQKNLLRAVNISVDSTRLDALMAALTFYSPGARLMYGAGF